jgi:hypothetical protein
MRNKETLEEFRKIASKELLEKFDTDCLKYSEDGDSDNYFYANCKYWESKLKEEHKQEPKQETLEEVKLRQIFKNLSDCYADTGSFENDGSYHEGEVIQAMTEDTFIKIINEWQQDKNKYSEEDLKLAYSNGQVSIINKSYTRTEEWFEQFKNK